MDQFLTFTINQQLYGAPITTVREINRMGDITPVPRTPDYVAGVMNLRGKVIPVVNLRMKLNFPAIASTKSTCIIVIESPIGQVGMIVDAVNGVIELSKENIEPPPQLGNAKALEFVLSLGKVDSNVIILIDIMKVLDASEMAAIQPGALERAA